MVSLVSVHALDPEFVGVVLQIPKSIQVGNKVLILHPAYVAGKVGVVYGRESPLDGQPSNRWLIQVDTDNILVSLTPQDFQVISL
ncbi:hypothetical protein [Anabaena sp. CCY 9402-a]|uniref:hypothetical protein n=1 Tax=Anabaena sp. CCY 9402-a TaxID=3103867 RepID=UPI0039C6881B